MKVGNLSLKEYFGYVTIKRFLEFFSLSAIISVWYFFYSGYNKIDSNLFNYLTYGIFVSPFIMIFTGYILYSYIIDLIYFLLNIRDRLITIFISPAIFCSEAVYYYFARLDSGLTRFVGYMEAVVFVFVVYAGIGYYVLKNFMRD